MMSKKKNLLLLVAALVVVALVVVAIMLNNRKDSGTDTPQNPQSNSKEEDKDAALLGETFNDSQAGVSMKLPKGWQLAPKSEENPASLTRFVRSQDGDATGQANGELTATKSNASMNDVVRGYLEATRDIDATPTLVANQDTRIGDKTVRLLSQEMPGPGGVSGRITQYIYYKNSTYYILTFTMLSSDWEQQQPAIEAAVRSLKVTP